MRGDWLDLGLAVVAVLFAWRGYRNGLLVSAATVAGLVGGAWLAMSVVAPRAQRLVSPALRRPVAIAVVVLLAVVGQEGAAWLAWSLRRRLGRDPLSRVVGQVDALGGAVGQVAALLFVAWAMAMAVSVLPPTGLTPQIQDSLVLHGVDSVVPVSVSQGFSGLLRSLQDRAFPPIFNHFQQQRLLPTPAPTPGAVPASVIDADAPSIVKILASEPECSTGSEGSGFVESGDHVVTNAHVVAGARSVEIVDNGAGRVIDAAARVVYYNPRIDVAVLYVAHLGLPALRFAGPAQPGAQAAVVGYPQNGPFTVDPARVRGVEMATGPDIYQDAQVTRQIYALRAVVRPGNSGGPLLDPAGAVDGIVFARGVGVADTGFALTAAEVQPAVVAAEGSTAAVPTEGCT